MKSLLDVNLELLRVFFQVAKLGSMTAAASALHVTQPAVSHAVNQLEDLLGCRLFQRVSRRLVLTAEGESLLATAGKVFGVLSEGDARLKDIIASKNQVLRIGCPQLLLQTALTSVLATFHEACPEVRTRLKIENRMQDMLDLVRNNEVDLQFLATPQMELLDPGLEEQTLGGYRYAFGASWRHFSQLKGRALSWDELNRLPLIVLRSGNNTRDYLERWFVGQGLTLHVVFETETMAETEALAKAGFGLAAMLVPESGFAGVGLAEELFELNVVPTLPKGRYVMLRRKGAGESQPMKRFLECLQC